MDDIAAASGVAKTTIYRRWPSLTLLVLETIEEAVGTRAVPDTGGLLADLEALIGLVVRPLVDNPLGATIRTSARNSSASPNLPPTTADG